MRNGMAMPRRHGMPRRLACGCYAPPAGMLAAMAVNEASPGSVASPVNVEAAAGARSKSASEDAGGLVIDCHGHYTTEPKALFDWRKRQIDAIGDPSRAPGIDELKIGDDEPRASGMGHHVGDAAISSAWSRVSNDLIFRLTQLYPKNFVGVCQLPQSTGVAPKNCVAELERCVNELGFVGCNLNPDPSGGFWKEPPLTDKWWYPLYEKMVELDVPAMVHVSASANSVFHATGAHYINGDTTAFMQFLTSDLFRDFPTLKFIIPHGGGAVPYHWGRYRGLAQDMKRPPLSELLLDNVFFDTCVYHQAGIDLLTKVIPAKNILFASEMVGAVRGIDPETGYPFDDTKRYIEQSPALGAADRRAIFETNARAVYGRLSARLD
jgi:4-oxalmesaconate hydratase